LSVPAECWLRPVCTWREQLQPGLRVLLRNVWGAKGGRSYPLPQDLSSEEHEIDAIVLLGAVRPFVCSDGVRVRWAQACGRSEILAAPSAGWGLFALGKIRQYDDELL
jgi:hypothetical protein